MLDVLIYLAIALVVIVGAILLVASRRPGDFAYTRTTHIAAPPEQLFGMINDLHQMNTWNPYALREKGGTAEYSGPASGPGARFDFAGSKSGSGHIDILESSFPSSVVMRLEMVKPFKADHRVDFTIAPAASGANVTWSMSGKQPLPGKVMTLFIDCDRMVGRDFEEGLANLKRIAEAA